MDLSPNTKNSFKELKLGAIVVLLLASNTTTLSDGLRKFVSLISSPITYYAGASGSTFDEIVDSVSQIGSLKEDNNRLKIELAQKKAELQNVGLVVEENNRLKEELSLGIKERVMVEAKVLGNGVAGVDDFMLVNKGQDDGIKQGDIVSIGNIFIGIVSSVEKDSSKVMLSSSESSFLEVFIVDSELSSLSAEEMKSRFAEDSGVSKLFSGIAIGTPSGIRIDNIITDADIKKGDAIVVNDIKVGEFLYLGTISSINDDPTLTQKDAFVTVPLNYQQLNFVFIHSK